MIESDAIWEEYFEDVFNLMVDNNQFLTIDISVDYKNHFSKVGRYNSIKDAIDALQELKNTNKELN